MSDTATGRHPAAAPATSSATAEDAAATIEIILNGEPRAVPAALTVAALLAWLGLEPGGLAVERNLEIVPRSRHADTPVEAGDRLEIVQFVGGG